MRREYIQNNWIIDDDLGFSTNFLCHFVDSLSDFVEVGELFLLAVLYDFIELCIGRSELWDVVHTQL